MGGKGKGGFSGRGGFGDGAAVDFGAFSEGRRQNAPRDPDEGPAEVEEGEPGKGSQGVSFNWGKRGAGLRKNALENQSV